MFESNFPLKTILHVHKDAWDWKF